MTDDNALPEKMLLYAILERAIRDDAGCVESIAAKNSIPGARAWIASDHEHKFSFLWICEQLGLDPVRLRRERLKLRGKTFTGTARYVDMLIKNCVLESETVEFHIKGP